MKLTRPFVLLVTGPAGAGKTTAAAAWAAAQAYPTAHVSLDAVRLNIRSGLAHPEDGWNRETQRQYELARRACAGLARLYVRHGFTCVIDDAIFPDWKPVGYAGWRSQLRGVSLGMVVLLPTLAIVARRNRRRRDGDHPPLPTDLVRTIYEMMLPWVQQSRFPVIDTSTLSIAETVAAINAAVQIEENAPNETMP